MVATEANEPKSTPDSDPNFNEMTPQELIKYFGGTKSSAIRGLHAHDYPVKHIAKMLNILYQHARNVTIRELKRGPNGGTY